jgi:hypothetical protein
MAGGRRISSKPETVEVTISDIEWIKSTLSSMSIKLHEVESNFSKLNQTVIGDKAYGQIGLVQTVESHSTYIEKDKQFKSKLVGGGLVISFVWGLILKFWKV